MQRDAIGIAPWLPVSTAVAVWTPHRMAGGNEHSASAAEGAADERHAEPRPRIRVTGEPRWLAVKADDFYRRHATVLARRSASVTDKLATTARLARRLRVAHRFPVQIVAEVTVTTTPSPCAIHAGTCDGWRIDTIDDDGKWSPAATASDDRIGRISEVMAWTNLGETDATCRLVHLRGDTELGYQIHIIAPGHRLAATLAGRAP